MSFGNTTASEINVKVLTTNRLKYDTKSHSNHPHL